jgi:hypothetical protein
LCTVTFLPLPNHGFLLTQNRDEHHTRRLAIPPSEQNFRVNGFVSPLDEQGGGTWIASNKKFSLCLLNGGFEKHKHQPPYRHSRGLVLVDFFSLEDIDTFYRQYNVDQIEPFTLLIVEHASRRMVEIVYDGTQLFLKEMNSEQAHIWSSTTLYSIEQREQRKVWFANWLNEHTLFRQEDILDFHQYGGEEEEGIQINRDSILFTVSLTSIFKSESDITMYYKDFIQGKQTTVAIERE